MAALRGLSTWDDPCSWALNGSGSWDWTLVGAAGCAFQCTARRRRLDWQLSRSRKRRGQWRGRRTPAQRTPFHFGDCEWRQRRRPPSWWLPWSRFCQKLSKKGLFLQASKLLPSKQSKGFQNKQYHLELHFVSVSGDALWEVPPRWELSQELNCDSSQAWCVSRWIGDFTFFFFLCFLARAEKIKYILLQWTQLGEAVTVFTGNSQWRYCRLCLLDLLAQVAISGDGGGTPPVKLSSLPTTTTSGEQLLFSSSSANWANMTTLCGTLALLVINCVSQAAAAELEVHGVSECVRQSGRQSGSRNPQQPSAEQFGQPLLTASNGSLSRPSRWHPSTSVLQCRQAI